MGHGHVMPNPDGTKMGCGGPSICAKCAREYAAKHNEEWCPAPVACAETELTTLRARVEELEEEAKSSVWRKVIRECQDQLYVASRRADKAEAERDLLAAENAYFVETYRDLHTTAIAIDVAEAMGREPTHEEWHAFKRAVCDVDPEKLADPRTRLMLAASDVGTVALSWAEDVGECVLCELDDDGKHEDECPVDRLRIARAEVEGHELLCNPADTNEGEEPDESYSRG